MQIFETIAKNWIHAIRSGQFDYSFQAVETNSSDPLAKTLQTFAKEAGVCVFAMEYDSVSLADPHELFHRIMEWFGEQYGDDWIEGQIEEQCYTYHRDLMKAWYRQAVYFRYEPLLYDEADYEAREFLNGIERLLDAMAARKPFIVLISQVDQAPDAVQQALQRWLKGVNRNRAWGVIGFIKQARRVRRLQAQVSWQECLRLLERQELILPIETEPDDSASKYPWDRPRTFKKYQRLYRMLIRGADTFCYSDIIRMVNQVYPKYPDEKAGQLLFLSAYCALMNHDLDTAIQTFTSAQNLLQSTNSEGVLTGTYFWMSICFTLKTQEKRAREAQEQCEKLALEYQDERWYALSQFADYYIDAHLAQHQLTQGNIRSLRHLLSELGFNNLLALVLTQVYSRHDPEQGMGPKDYLRNCVQALRTSRQAGNMLGVSVALHAMGVVYMRIGNVRQTERLYHLSLGLRERYQSDGDLVPMLNALGYFLIGQEEWQKAWSMFDRALGLLIVQRNFNEASITLYNFVWLYAQSGDINQALDLMNDLLELMKIRAVEGVPFRNLKDLYVLKGWLHIQLRQPIQARYCLVRIQGLKHLHETEFSTILREIVNARLALMDGEKALSYREAQRAHRHIENAFDLDHYMETTLRLETARLFIELGHKDRAAPIFTELRRKAHKRQLDTLAQRISRASLGISYLSDVTLPSVNQPYRVLMEIARKETQLLSIQNELAQYHQMNLLLEMSAETDQVGAFLEQVIDVLDRRIPANDFAILLPSADNDDYPVKPLYSNGVSEDLSRHWLQRLSHAPQREQSFSIGEDECLALPLKVEVVENGWLVMGGDAQQRQVWDVTFMIFLAQQLGLILDRRLREAYLEHRNKTDLLTGVLNRAGLFERLKKLFAQLKRQPEQPFALCYFDLDHFKYFNDHFGHELGDGVLKALTARVAEQLRGSDELCRLGGDEFILLLPQTDRESAAAMVERLRQTLAEPEWWLPLVVQTPEEDANPVPESEWISASFGVVVFDRWPENGVSRIDLIAQGDKAMYEAKQKGKNRVVVREFSVPSTD